MYFNSAYLVGGGEGKASFPLSSGESPAVVNDFDGGGLKFFDFPRGMADVRWLMTCEDFFGVALPLHRLLLHNSEDFTSHRDNRDTNA